MIAAFNPATNPSDYVAIAVRHGNYDVSVYNYQVKQFMPLTKSVSAAVICEDEVLPNGVDMKNCWMHLDYPIDSQ